MFAGDTIHVECEVIEARRSQSRPNRGLVRTRNRIVKQDGTLVQEYTPLRMVKAAARWQNRSTPERHRKRQHPQGRLRACASSI